MSTGIVTGIVVTSPDEITKPLLITIPHSGERVPAETPWLEGLQETLLMFDVDRYVDRLYEPVIRKLGVPAVKTEWHRYAIDLNRLADDVDADSVIGHQNPSGTYPRGLHWSITTKNEKLMPGPISSELHDLLVERYFEPFHQQVRGQLQKLRSAGASITYHVDLHSMPSKGTKEHKDPGEYRADVVVSDVNGKSCSASFKDLVIGSYEAAGFKVAYNWPYMGGRVTQTYGRPEIGQEAIQVELNRALYMDEQTKQLSRERLAAIQARLSQAMTSIFDSLKDVSSR